VSYKKNKKLKKSQKMAIFVIKVTTNKEERAMEMISDKVRKKSLPVYSLTRPHGLRGYIFLEALDRESAEDSAFNLPYVKGIIGKTLTYEEIKNMLTPNLEEVKIDKGDIVEIIGEPFKKEKAKVTRVDKQKGEVVVSLLNAVVPIPVTVKIDNVRVLRRDEDMKEEQARTDSNNNNAEQQSLSTDENFQNEMDEGPLGMH
jgi:transcriptional antiterminator NusG